MAKDIEEDDLLPDKDAAKGFYAKYEPKEILGRGISSTVRRCIEKESGKEFAAKIIDLGAATETGETNPMHMLEATRQEISILRQVMGHPYIIELQDVFESDAFVFLVFELCPKGELFDYLTSVVTLSEKKTRTIMRQIFEGVEYIHSKNIVHRDLKPENILLDENHNVKITDFGFARQLKESEKLTDLCGTPGYLAPETLKCNMFDGAAGYSKEVDIWACGVIMFTLLVGCPPFWHRKQMVMLRNIMEGKYSFTSPEWTDISEDPKDLIRKCLVVDPAKRITVKEVLRHPFFNQMLFEQNIDGIKRSLSHKSRRMSRIDAQIALVLLPEPSIDGRSTTYLLKAQSFRASDDDNASVNPEQYSLKVVLNRVLSTNRRSTAKHSTDKLNNNNNINKTINHHHLAPPPTSTSRSPSISPKRKISPASNQSTHPYAYSYNQNYVNNIQVLGPHEMSKVLDKHQQQQQQHQQQLIREQQKQHGIQNEQALLEEEQEPQGYDQITCEIADDETVCEDEYEHFDEDEDEDEEELRKQSRFNARKKFQNAILVIRAVIRIRRLRFTAEPLRVEEAIRDPYRVKVLRKVIDGCAFRVYGHWVKKGEGQNRAALFENTPRTELHALYINNLSR